MQTKIGNWAIENQFQHHVAILPRIPQNNRTVLCSGAFIAKGWVLTTAICVLQSYEYEVRFGSVNHYTGGSVVISREAYVHPDYDSLSQRSNIGLIRTSLYGGATIDLAPVSWNATGRFSLVSGWSQLYGSPSPILQYAFGNIIGPFDLNCLGYYGKDVVDPSERLCASFTELSVCVGDSGSPLIIWTSYLVGVSSFNAEDRRCKSSYSLFVSLTQRLRDWIVEVTGTKP